MSKEETKEAPKHVLMEKNGQKAEVDEASGSVETMKAQGWKVVKAEAPKDPAKT